MNQEIKRKWIQALRSGAYKQGKNMLQSSKGEFCSLGVLCDIFVKENPEIEWKNHEVCCYLSGRMVKIIPVSYGAPPYIVGVWAGFDNGIPPKLIYNNYKRSLIFLNDTKSLPFFEIADLIEAQL